MKNLDPKVMAENERKELQDRYIRFDWAIKRLLRQKANFDVLNGFLTVVLREEVRILEILESESNQESASDKFNRVNEFDKVATTPLDEWIKYLKDGTIRPDTTTPGLREAREKLKYYSMFSQERHAYDEHLNVIMIQNDVLDTAKWEGRIEGLAEGEAKGKAEALRQTAVNMKRMGMEITGNAKCTGLSVEEIEAL